MELTRERALELHRQMWSDMQRDLGDCPDSESRSHYKRRWIAVHFPELSNELPEIILNNCFLCEYDGNGYSMCNCPIVWPGGKCEDHWDDEKNWSDMPISQLLALPEREVE